MIELFSITKLCLWAYCFIHAVFATVPLNLWGRDYHMGKFFFVSYFKVNATICRYPLSLWHLSGERKDEDDDTIYTAFSFWKLSAAFKIWTELIRTVRGKDKAHKRKHILLQIHRLTLNQNKRTWAWLHIPMLICDEWDSLHTTEKIKTIMTQTVAVSVVIHRKCQTAFGKWDCGWNVARVWSFVFLWNLNIS